MTRVETRLRRGLMEIIDDARHWNDPTERAKLAEQILIRWQLMAQRAISEADRPLPGDGNEDTAAPDDWQGDQYSCAVCRGSANGNTQYIPEAIWCCDCCAGVLHRAADMIPPDPPPRHGPLSVARARELYQEAKDAGYEPGSLMANPEFREIHAQFQKLWTEATNQDGYSKKDWQQMDALLGTLARKAGM